MNKQKIISLSLISAFIFGSAFSTLFSLKKDIIVHDEIYIAQEIQNRLDEYQEKYLINDPIFKEQITSKAIFEVGNYAKKLYEEKEISSYQINKESVVITNKCGLIAAFSPVISGTYSGDKIVLNYTKVLPNMMIYNEAKDVVEGRQPLPEGFHNDAELMPAVCKDLANEFTHVNYDEKDFIKAVPLSKEFLQSLGPNQLVMLLGHGTYVEGYHSTLNTSRQFSWEDYQNDPTYREDVRNGLIVDTPGGEAFTTRYIEKYVGDLTNTFIYFGECESAKDNALANCFLAKGAAALVANTQAISMRYGDLMQYTTVKNLTTKKDDGSYHTIKEALQIAKDKYGECDPDGLHSTPTLFGNENYSLDSTIKAPLYHENYEYTGEEITFVKPGVGFHVKDEATNKGIDAGLYEFEIVLEDGYKWPNDEDPDVIDVFVNITKKRVHLEDLGILPVALTDLETDGEPVNLFKPGETDIGKFTYALEENGQYIFEEEIPSVNKPGTYNIAWLFEGDKNHADLGDYQHGFQYTVVVKQKETPIPITPTNNGLPAWGIALICVGGGLLLVGAILYVRFKRKDK